MAAVPKLFGYWQKFTIISVHGSDYFLYWKWAKSNRHSISQAQQA